MSSTTASDPFPPKTVPNKTSDRSADLAEMERAAAAGCPFAAAGLKARAAVPETEGALARQPAADTSPVPGLDALPALPEPSMSKLVQTYRFMTDPFPLLAEVRAECGDIFVLDILGLGRMAFVCSAELLHEIYRKPEDMVIAGEMRRKFLERLTGKRVSTNIDGPEYAHRRKVTTPFLSGRRIARYDAMIQRLTEDVSATWTAGSELALQPVLDELSRKVICRVLFGPLEAPAAKVLVERSAEFLEAFQWPAVQIPPLQRSFGPWSPWARYNRRREALCAAIRAEMDRRSGAPAGDTADEPDDMMAALMAERFHDDDVEQREIVVEELVGMLIGGAETTSKALAWTLAGALADSRIPDRVRGELAAEVGDRPLTTEDLPRLPFLDALVQEGLRHQPVAPFAGPRMAKKEFELGGYRVDPGTGIVQCLSEVGRSEVFPNADAFDPKNFFRRDVKSKDWVPFGGGRRVCTGMGLAKLELALIVATLLRRFDFELDGGSLAPTKAGIAYQPKNGLRVRVLART